MIIPNKNINTIRKVKAGKKVKYTNLEDLKKIPQSPPVNTKKCCQ